MTDNDAFTPPLGIGLHLTEQDERFVAAVSLRNPLNRPVSLTTMSGKLFSVDLMTKRDILLWGSEQVATQAVTHWELDPNSRITKHFAVPNTDDAEARAAKRWERYENDLFEEFADYEVIAEPVYMDLAKFRAGIDEARTDQATERAASDGETKVFTETAVDPAEVEEIVELEAGIPTRRNYSLQATRQYDLRRSLDALDDELPDATLEAVRKAH